MGGFDGERRVVRISHVQRWSVVVSKSSFYGLDLSGEFSGGSGRLRASERFWGGFDGERRVVRISYVRRWSVVVPNHHRPERIVG